MYNQQESTEDEIQELWCDCNRYFFIKDEELDRYGDDVIPLLTTLEGTITAVPNMQKQLFSYVIYWETNASLPVSFDVNHLQVHCFKGDQSLMDLLKRARQLYDLQYPEANGIGPLKLPTNSTQTFGNLRQAHSTNTTR